MARCSVGRAVTSVSWMRTRSRGGIPPSTKTDIQAVFWARDPVIDTITLHYDRPVPESESGGGKRHLNPEFATLFGPPPSKLEVTALARPVDDLPSPVVVI